MAFGFSVRLSRELKRFRDEWRRHARTIRRIAEESFGDDLEAVYVFGSTIRGDYGVLSDIDVAIVLKEDVDDETRARFRSLIRRSLGNLHPFEIHIMSRDEWEGWYLRFVGPDFVEV